MNSFLLFWALLMCLICSCQSMDRYRNKICYIAKTCIHNAKEKCGKDGQGNYRRFYDSCDLLEYNCLKGTDFTKTSNSNCRDLPAIDDSAQNKNKYVPSNAAGTQIYGEPAIEGEININDDAIEGEINVNENAPELEPTSNLDNPGAEEPAIEAEIEIDDDDHNQNPESLNSEQPEVEGEIEIDDDEIRGSIEFNENLEMPGYNAPNKQELALEGSMEIGDDEVTKDTAINNDLETLDGEPTDSEKEVVTGKDSKTSENSKTPEEVGPHDTKEAGEDSAQGKIVHLDADK